MGRTLGEKVCAVLAWQSPADRWMYLAAVRAFGALHSTSPRNFNQALRPKRDPATIVEPQTNVIVLNHAHVDNDVKTR